MDALPKSSSESVGVESDFSPHLSKYCQEMTNILDQYGVGVHTLFPFRSLSDTSLRCCPEEKGVAKKHNFAFKV